MSANSWFLVILVGFALATLTLSVASIRWGLKWARIAEVSFLKALGLFFLLLVGGAIAGLVVGIIAVFAFKNPPELALDIAGTVAQLVGMCLAVVAIYKVRLLRAAKALVPFVASMLAILTLLFLVVRPIAYEAYVIPSNGMAPTLVGDHRVAPCPDCGAPAFGSPVVSRDGFPADGTHAICSTELKTVYITNVPQIRSEGDRILACKLLEPQRWDLIVFRYPQDPSVSYVKRLVGLPGEKLEIRDDAIWVNGERIEPPNWLHNIHYSAKIRAPGQEYSGPGSVPVKLGPDEYFVLGDFLDASSDSRMWERGAPGHPPYAVPASNIIGVVINIYWPPGRWTSFR